MTRTRRARRARRSSQERLEIEVGILRATFHPRATAIRPRLAALRAQADIAPAVPAEDRVGQDRFLGAIRALVKEQVIALEAALFQLVLEGIELVLGERGHATSLPRWRV